jgi:hypothetical protein
VYLVAVVLAGVWSYLNWRAIESGALSDLSGVRLVGSFLPGCLFLAVLLCCTLVVRNFFATGSGSNNALEQTRDE